MQDHVQCVGGSKFECVSRNDRRSNLLRPLEFGRSCRCAALRRVLLRFNATAAESPLIAFAVICGCGSDRGTCCRCSTSLTLRKQVAREIELRLPAARSRKIAGLILAQATNSLCDDLAELKSPNARNEAIAAIRRRLARWQNIADHLSEPWRVVLAGAPNVGKSSLLNAIAGMERSIVYDQPGTTSFRDIVEVDTVIDGWPFRFVDTAGIRMDGDAGQIESLGIQQSYLAVSQCDVLCLVVDDRSESRNIESLMLNNLPMHVVVVRNKCDLRTSREACPIAKNSLNAGFRIASLPDQCVSIDGIWA